MKTETIMMLNNLVSGFLGAFILFLIQNFGNYITKVRYKIRTSLLIKIYFRMLENELRDYGTTAENLKLLMNRHVKGGAGNLSLTYKGSENIDSNVLRQDRYSEYFEKYAREEKLVKYYKLCNLLDLLKKETPQMISTSYAEVAMRRDSEKDNYNKISTRLITRLGACSLNAEEAIKLCKALSEN